MPKTTRVLKIPPHFQWLLTVSSLFQQLSQPTKARARRAEATLLPIPSQFHFQNPEKERSPQLLPTLIKPTPSKLIPFSPNSHHVNSFSLSFHFSQFRNPNQIKSLKMENSEKESSMATSKQYGFSNGHSPRSPNHSSWFEIRLFCVRIAPCVIDSVPDHLTLRHLRREIGVSLEINNSRIPASESASLTLRRDRLDKKSSEVTYVSTDSVRVTGGVEFEVYENQDLVLCGSLEPVVANWLNGSVSSDNDAKTGWTMDCYMAASIGSGSSAFFQPKLGVSAPSFEVYIAGCCSGVPVILTKTIQISPRRKVLRHAVLDAIPEDEEIGKEQRNGNGLVRHRKVQFTESEVDDYEPDGKINYGFYSEEMYPGEDGQLSWFNAGVRVGVGIGLGMCLGIGIGVGLLMRSYQATTSNFRRRFR